MKPLKACVTSNGVFNSDLSEKFLKIRNFFSTLESLWLYFIIRHISSNLSSRTSDVIIICKSWISILHAFCAAIYSWNSARDVHCRLWSTWPDFSLKSEDEKFRRMTHFIASFFSVLFNILLFLKFFIFILFLFMLSQFHCIIMVHVNLMFTMQNKILCCHIPITSVQEHVLLPCHTISTKYN